ncbi:MAG TPA: DsbA family oxidoreductase [Micromonosporaceae bacterium]
MDIDVYSDVVCPWCYIGKRRLEAALSRYDGDVKITYKPFQLDPSTPTDGRPLLDWLGPKFGGAARAREMTAHTSSVAAADGITMDFGKAIIANTFNAHRLIWFAGDEHGAAVAEALHKAHFTDGLDIGSFAVLTSVAASVGLDADAVRAFLDSSAGVDEVSAEIAEAHDLGISSVPTFVFAGKYAVSGAQDPDLLLQTLQEVARRESATAVLQPIGADGQSCDDDSCAV